MKRSIFFIVLLALLFPLIGISQNNAPIIDDIYYKPGVTNKTQPSNKPDRNSANKPNYKNGAKEIIYKETTGAKPKTIIRDTVYVVGEAGDVKRNTNKKPVSSLVNSDILVIHDTIYVSEISIDDSIQNNQDKGYYLNGFNGNSSDLEYAERIRRFHNPRYTVFIGDPSYNDIYFLNNNDWNVYIDGSYAYVTPTWTNPYWWNYNFSPYSYGSFGWGYGGFGLGFGWNNYPWSYNNFYGGLGGYWGGYYGFGSYWGDYYGYGYPYGYGYGGYGYPYGYGYGYGGSYSFNKNRNHDEGARREVSNYGSGGSRLGGTRNSSSMMISGGNTSRAANQYTVVSNTRSNTPGNTNTLSTRSASTRSEAALNSRTVTNQASGIGVVRASGITTRTIDNNGQNSSGVSTTTRTSSVNINTRPRTYSTTVTTTPTDNYTSRQNSSYTNASSNRTSYTEGSRTVISNSTPSYQTRSNSSYNSNNSSSSSRSYTPASSYSSPSSSSSSSSSSSGSSGGGSRSSSSGGGGSRR